MLKETPLIVGHLCCADQPGSQGKAAAGNGDSQVTFREMAHLSLPLAFLLTQTYDSCLSISSLSNPSYKDALLPKCKFLVWLESL